MNLTSSLLWLLPVLPLIGAFINGSLSLAGARTLHGPSRGFVALIAVLAPAASFVLTVLLAAKLPPAAVAVMGPAPTGAPAFTQVLWDWLSFGSVHVPFNLLFDNLTALMLLFVTGIGTLIHLYSVGYMWGDRGFARFMAYLNLFMFSMIMLVLGGSLPVTFLGWEGVGLCSYLLIGFWHTNADYNDAARKAFVVNRIGDLGFLLGAFVLLYVVGSLDYRDISAWFQSDANAAGIAAKGGLIAAAGLLLFFGCTGKSAQVPLLTWLPDAMAGPTPVSALIHAATMVTSGVYLVARLADMYVHAGALHLFGIEFTVLQVIMVTGLLTAVFGAVAGLFQNDIKKALAYSTVSQLGFMFMAAGAGAFDVALFHVFTHAFFKATLFLGAGAVIHGLHHEQDMRRMGGLAKAMPIAHLAMCYGWFAIIGLPGGSGFMSKDLILERLFGLSGTPELGLMVGMIAVATACLTAVYMSRVMFLTFWSPSRVAPEVRHHIHGTPITMAIPLIILGFGSLLAGLLWTEHIPQFSLVFFKNFLEPVVGPAQALLSPPMAEGAGTGAHHGASPLTIAAWGIGAALLGLLIAWANYRKGPRGRTVAEHPGSEPYGFGAAWTWAFDRVYDWVFVKPVKIIGLLLYWIVELAIVGGLTYAVAGIANFLGDGYASVQRSRLRSSLALSAVGLVVIVVFLLSQLG